MANDIIQFLGDVENKIATLATSLERLRKPGSRGHVGMIKDLKELSKVMGDMRLDQSIKSAEKALKNLEKISVNSSNNITKNKINNQRKQTQEVVNNVKIQNKVEDQLFKRRIDRLTSLTGQLAGFFKMQMLWYPAKAITFKVLAIPKDVLKTTSEYSDALAQLSSVAQLLPNQLDKLDKKIQDVATSSKFGLLDISEAAKQLAQAGFSGKEIINVLEPIKDLATATASGLNQTTSVISTIIRAYKLSASDAVEISDVLANAVTKSRLTIDQLNESFSYVASAAAQAGVSYKDTVTQLAMLANAGLKSTTAATGLRMALLKMISPTEKAAKALKAVGLSVDDISIKKHGLEAVLQTLEKLDSDTLIKVFSARSANAILALTNVGDEARKLMRESLDLQGIAAKMAEEQLLDLKQSWANLGQTVQTVAYGVGKTFGDELAVKVRAFRNLIVDINKHADTLGNIVQFITKSILALITVSAGSSLSKFLGFGGITKEKRSFKELVALAVQQLRLREATMAEEVRIAAILKDQLATSTLNSRQLQIALAEAGALKAEVAETSILSKSMSGIFNYWAIALTVVVGVMISLFNNSRKLAEQAERANSAIKEFAVNIYKALNQLTTLRISTAKYKSYSEKGLSKESLGDIVGQLKQDALEQITEVRKIYKNIGLKQAIIDSISESITSSGNIDDIKIALDKLSKELYSTFNPETVRDQLIKRIEQMDQSKVSSALRSYYLALVKGFNPKEAITEASKTSGFTEEQIKQIAEGALGIKAILEQIEAQEKSGKKSIETIRNLQRKLWDSITNAISSVPKTGAVSKTTYDNLITPIKNLIEKLKSIVSPNTPEFKALQHSINDFKNLQKSMFIAPNFNEIEASFTEFENNYSKLYKKLLRKVKAGMGVPAAKEELIKVFNVKKQKELTRVKEEIKLLKAQETERDISKELLELERKKAEIENSNPLQQTIEFTLVYDKRLQSLSKTKLELLKTQRDLLKISHDTKGLRENEISTIDAEIEKRQQLIDTLFDQMEKEGANVDLLEAQQEVLYTQIDILKEQKEALPTKYLKEDWEIRKKSLETQIKGAKLRKEDMNVRLLTIQMLKEEIATLQTLDRTKMSEQEADEIAVKIQEDLLRITDLMKQTEAATFLDGIKLSLKHLADEYAETANISKVGYELMTESTHTFVSSFSDAVISVGDGTKSISQAFKDMAKSVADVVQQLLVKKAVMMLLGAFIGNFNFGGTSTTDIGSFSNDFSWGAIHHKGGVVGKDLVPKRKVPSALFDYAPRLHNGLRADEFPAILQKGEQVIPKNQVGEETAQVFNISINAVDAASFSELTQRNPEAIVAPFIDAMQSGHMPLISTLRGVR